MSKIKFRLEKFEKALVFQVLEMDERFRARDDDHVNSYTALNAVDVCSAAHPFLISNEDGVRLYLRGTDTGLDSSIAECSFKTNTERDVAYTNIINALQDWAKYCPQFQTWATDSDAESIGVFEF